jgi:hypothetical protein
VSGTESTIGSRATSIQASEYNVSKLKRTMPRSSALGYVRACANWLIGARIGTAVALGTFVTWRIVVSMLMIGYA